MKCSTCSVRYVCDEIREWDCKNHDYRNYSRDIFIEDNKIPTNIQYDKISTNNLY